MKCVFFQSTDIEQNSIQEIMQHAHPSLLKKLYTYFRKSIICGTINT